ncbi:HD family phosphohydrolase [Lacticaseibacillus kribbianus]|uniref:HD family phosphohydrolase n=1 Tax=Lacticaseibacillus kribbianus TaxID=2926292 RepID=UPI001CD7B96D|nr:HDIG domain-containing metalloprotein [Lacticaseibacillus kribbianus]
MDDRKRGIRQLGTGLIIVVFAVVSFLMLVWQVLPQPLSIKVNSVATQTIIATQTVQDVQRTKEAKTAAKNAVTPVYAFDNTVAGKQQDALTRLKKAVAATVTAETAKAQDKKGTYKAPSAKALREAFRDTYAKADYPYFYQFKDSFYTKLFDLTASSRTAVFTAAAGVVSTQMASRLNPDTVAAAVQNAKTTLRLTSLSKSARALAGTLAEQTIVPNELIDATQTKAKKAAAAAAVSPVLIMQGQVIVQAGHLVDATTMHQLAVLGLTKQRKPLALIGLILLEVVQVATLWGLLRLYPPRERAKNAGLYAGVMLFMLAVMAGLRFVATTGQLNLTLLLPAAFAPLLLRTFIGRRFALLAALMQTLFAYYAFYSTTGYIFTGGTAVVYLVTGVLAVMISRVRLNDALGPVAFWVLGVNGVVNLSLLLMQGADFARASTWQTVGYTLIGLVLGYVLAIGVTPYLEMLWRDDAIFKLNKLSNPNDPLLKQLLEEAPGTYHHSMMVANLAANAVAAVGGRQMLTRVACYYHDVGKLTRPLYFTENMPAGYESPHHALTPQESAAIIFAHVSDGVAMLQKRHMPQFIIDVCAQHHGTTLMKYFYITAKNADPSTKESAFRYPGPKPQTLEAAVVNIADTCEAAVRSMKHPTPDGIATFVHNIINERVVDGQFAEAPISMAQFAVVEQSLVNGLASTFYNRIEYPKLKNEDEGDQTHGSRTD